MMNGFEKAGERILMMRNRRGYTRDYLAEHANISPKFLYEIECGKKGFSARVLNDLCIALEVNSDYILTGKADIGYDQKLIDVLELFKMEQTDKLCEILKNIYELLKVS